MRQRRLLAQPQLLAQPRLQLRHHRRHVPALWRRRPRALRLRGPASGAGTASAACTEGSSGWQHWQHAQGRKAHSTTSAPDPTPAPIKTPSPKLPNTHLRAL